MQYAKITATITYKNLFGKAASFICFVFSETVIPVENTIATITNTNKIKANPVKP